MESQQIKEFGLTHFGGAALGDERRSKRLVTVAEQVMQHPEGTWPNKLPDPADLDAFYRLVNRPEVTHAAVLGPHRAETQARMRAATDTVLILHDTTELGLFGVDNRSGAHRRRLQSRLSVPQQFGSDRAWRSARFGQPDPVPAAAGHQEREESRQRPPT